MYLQNTINTKTLKLTINIIRQDNLVLLFKYMANYSI